MIYHKDCLSSLFQAVLIDLGMNRNPENASNRNLVISDIIQPSHFDGNWSSKSNFDELEDPIEVHNSLD